MPDQQVAPHTGRGLVRPTSLTMPPSIMPPSIYASHRKPPASPRATWAALRARTAFVLGPDQSSPRGDCRRRTTGALGAASLRPPLQARLRTECGLAAPLNRAIESCSSYQLSRVGGTKSSPLSAAAAASDSMTGSSFSVHEALAVRPRLPHVEDAEDARVVIEACRNGGASPAGPPPGDRASRRRRRSSSCSCRRPRS